MSDLLLSIRDLDAPALLWADGRAQDYLDTWAWHVGPVRQRHDADPEDFWEQAARLHAAVSTFGAHRVWLTTYDRRREPGPARNLGTRQERPLTELRHLTPYGSQHVVDARHGPDVGLPNQEVVAGDYMADAAFRENAGRRVTLCSNGAPGCPDLWETIASHAADGPARVVVKTASTKGGIWTLDVPAGFSPRDAHLLDDDDTLGWDTVRREGDPNAYLVQQWIPMFYEYRLFVVDHQVVTGAGCVEEHTPLDNAAPFDPKVRGVRGGNGPVESHPDAVETLVRFGRRVAAATKVERPEVADYVLDVALINNEAPVVVERNGLLNSGLYASDPRLVVAALARRAALVGQS